MPKRRSIIGLVVSLTIAMLLAIAGSDGSVSVGGFPLFAICGVVAFCVHWIAFVPAYIRRTEHFFDLTGSIAYVCVVISAWSGNSEGDFRSMLLCALVLIWSVRLGSFLFLRVRRAGQDDRFDRLKHDFLAFLMTWTLSGLWVFLTAAAALAAATSATKSPLDAYLVIGSLVWLIGFCIEVIADRQKSVFRSKPENRDRFISHGLWAWSRHPNYFGEITLWFGVAVIAYPVLSGWQMVTLSSPVFVWFLLTRVSGIPLLEAKAEKRWGDSEEYRRYRDRTSKLIPRPPKQTIGHDASA